MGIGSTSPVNLEEVHGLAVVVLVDLTMLQLVALHVDSADLLVEDGGEKRRCKAKDSHCVSVSVISQIKFYNNLKWRDQIGASRSENCRARASNSSTSPIST